MKKTKDKKIFSTASLFFIFTIGTLAFRYFKGCWDRTIYTKPGFTITIATISTVSIIIWLMFKFPIFVKIKQEKLDVSFYENIYSKNIGFLSRLYLVVFEFIKPNNLITLFSHITLSVGVKKRSCQFAYNQKPAKFWHRAFDIILTMLCSTFAFFVGEEITKFGMVFGVCLTFVVILLIYKKVIINYTYSINIGTHQRIKTNIMYPYNLFEGIFSKYYGLAYDFKHTILLNKDVFCGGDRLKKYVLAHEEGHMATKNPKKSFWITIAFVFASFAGISGPTIIQEIWPVYDRFVWLPTILYLIFLGIFNYVVSKKNKEDELKADVYALKKIGKEAVLDGLNIIKTDNLNINSKINLSGTSIDGRLEFVRKYEEH